MIDHMKTDKPKASPKASKKVHETFKANEWFLSFLQISQANRSTAIVAVILL